MNNSIDLKLLVSISDYEGEPLYSGTCRYAPDIIVTGDSPEELARDLVVLYENIALELQEDPFPTMSDELIAMLEWLTHTSTQKLYDAILKAILLYRNQDDMKNND